MLEHLYGYSKMSDLFSCIFSLSHPFFSPYILGDFRILLAILYIEFLLSLFFFMLLLWKLLMINVCWVFFFFKKALLIIVHLFFICCTVCIPIDFIHNINSSKCLAIC